MNFLDEVSSGDEGEPAQQAPRQILGGAVAQRKRRSCLGGRFWSAKLHRGRAGPPHRDSGECQPLRAGQEDVIEAAPAETACGRSEALWPPAVAPNGRSPRRAALHNGGL